MAKEAVCRSLETSGETLICGKKTFERAGSWKEAGDGGNRLEDFRVFEDYKVGEG